MILPSEIKLVGLVSKIGGGKDHMGKVLHQSLGFMPIEFADALKIAATALGKVTIDQCFTNPKPSEVRTTLQLLGTEVGRMMINEDVWVKAAQAFIYILNKRLGLTKFVFTDCRFINEHYFIRDHNGILIFLNAPDRWEAASAHLTEAQKSHASEVLGPEKFNYDAVIDNTLHEGIKAEAAVVSTVKQLLDIY